MLFLRAIKKVPGISASAIPLYLPPDETNFENGFDKEVFFGAISMFLREKVRFLRNMPSFMDKIFDSKPLLKIAARQAGATRTHGYEGLTLNMIEGGNAFRKDEVDRLVQHLVKGGKPDIIHLSNALIIGIAKHIKKRINVKIVCSLLNEDDWIDEMDEPYRSLAWKMIAKEAQHIDSFVTPSNYFMNLFTARTDLKSTNIHIVPLGFDPEFTMPEKNESHDPAIGFFSRINYHNGFDKLVDAFIDLKARNVLPGLTLNVCGGFTGDDKPFITSQMKKIREKGFQKSVKIFHEFHGDNKIAFFRAVDVISVPVRKYDGYGLYILEANSAGIPVVQPSTGAFPELLGKTEGGIIYSPDTVEELSAALLRLLNDRKSISVLGETGSKRVRSELSLAKMSSGLSAVYNNVS
jgi:glycosyltransferase involved in cell wall biosynthesis